MITGMTMGEAAKFYNKEYAKESVQLEVVPVLGYKRGVYFEETGIPWTTPSPNCRWLTLRETIFPWYYWKE